MSNGNRNVYERLFKLQTQISKLVMEGKRNPLAVADMLQRILEDSSTRYDLFFHGSPKKGPDLEAHLHENRLLGRCLSFDSPLVQSWYGRPVRYPESLREIRPILWGDVSGSGKQRSVTFLHWIDECLFVQRISINQEFDSNWPALLEPLPAP